MAIETVADIENSDLRCNTTALPQNMYDMREAIIREAPPTLKLALAGLTRDPYLRRTSVKPAAYVDIFVNNLLGIAQGPVHQQRQLWRIMFHSLDKVFRTSDSGDSKNRKELLLLKKILAVDCTWSTCQVFLGWVIKMVNMMLSLPPYRENCFKEILCRNNLKKEAHRSGRVAPVTRGDSLHSYFPNW